MTIADETSPIASASSVLTGDAFGVVYPGPPSPHLPVHDARDRALNTFALFVSLLRFARVGETPDGPPIFFRVPLSTIFVYQPDDVQNHAPRPGIGFLPGRARHEPYGLGPAVVLEDTADRFGDGTVVVRKGDHVETVGLEVVGSKPQELQAVVAGLKTALCMDDKSGALRLRCDNYFGMTASFRLDESETLDDADSTLNRRRGHLWILMQVPEVTLVRYRTMTVLAENEIGKDVDLG